jgi:4'-phosphopantetheinyl transferase
MPFHRLPDTQRGLQLGYWLVEESLEVLWQEAVPFAETGRLASLKKPERQLEYLASRAALKQLLPPGSPAVLFRDAFGKPKLANQAESISFSHTAGAGAAIVSSTEVGLDIEFIRPKIMQLAPKFLSASELEAAENNLLRTTLYWSAKEALYKLYGKKQLLFAEHLSVAPFTGGETGQTLGVIKTDAKTIHCRIEFRVLVNGLIITWCTPDY